MGHCGRVLALLFLLLAFNGFGANVVIIESLSQMPGHDMDAEWLAVATNMGHTASIMPQTTLDNLTSLSTADILVVSSGVITLPANRVTTILQFIQTGRSVYLQSEHLPSFSTNQAFASIVSSLGGSFNWTNNFSGNLGPMNVIGIYSTTNNPVSTLSYYWYSVAGVGDCNTINYLEHGGQYHGFHYIPANPAFGTINTNSDQDWVRNTTSVELMENIITNLWSPPTVTPSGISLDLGADTTLCQGDQLTLNAGGISNSTYLWHDGSTGPSYTVTQPGVFWVQVSSSCGSAVDSITVSVDTLFTVDLGNDTTLCQGSSFALDVTTTSATYTWQDGSTAPTFNVSGSGTYWVQLDAGCRPVSDTIHVELLQPPLVDLGNDTTLCQGDTLLLDTQFPSSSYLWQDGSTGPGHVVDQAGLFWVELTNGCGTDADSITVNFIAVPMVDLGNDTSICQSSSIVLNAGINNGSYTWSDGSNGLTLTVDQTGLYWVNVSVNGCTSIDSLDLLVVPQPVVDLGSDTTLCEGSDMLLDAHVMNATYLWSDLSTNAQLNVNAAGNYFVTVALGPCVVSDTIHVATDPVPQILFPDTSVSCIGAPIFLDATHDNAHYSWQDGSTAPFQTANDAGLYWVQVFIGPCSASDSTVVVLEDCFIDLIMPNVFSPNNDGVNDRFIPVEMKGVAQASLVILNRWGQELYSTTDLARGWNGKYDSNDCPDGVYWFVVDALDRNGVHRKRQGSFTLLR